MTGPRTPPLDTVSTSSSLSSSPQEPQQHGSRSLPQHSIAIPSNSDHSWRAVGSPPRKLSISAAILPSSPLYSGGGGGVGGTVSASTANLLDEDYSGYSRPAFRTRALSTPNPFFQIGDMGGESFSSTAAAAPPGLGSSKWGGISAQWSGNATAASQSPLMWQQHHEIQPLTMESSSDQHQFRRNGGSLSAGGGFSRQHRSLSFTLHSAEEDAYFKNRIEYEPLKDGSGGTLTPIGFDEDDIQRPPPVTRSRSKSSSAIFGGAFSSSAVSPLPPSPASLHGDNIWSMHRGPSPIDSSHLDIPFSASSQQLQQRRGSAQPRLGELWGANNVKSPLEDASPSSSLAYNGAPQARRATISPSSPAATAAAAMFHGNMRPQYVNGNSDSHG